MACHCLRERSASSATADALTADVDPWDALVRPVVVLVGPEPVFDSACDSVGAPPSAPEVPVELEVPVPDDDVSVDESFVPLDAFVVSADELDRPRDSDGPLDDSGESPSLLSVVEDPDRPPVGGSRAVDPLDVSPVLVAPGLSPASAPSDVEYRSFGLVPAVEPLPVSEPEEALCPGVASPVSPPGAPPPGPDPAALAPPLSPFPSSLPNQSM